MKGLELRYSNDCSLTRDNLYRLKVPVDGFTYLKVDDLNKKALFGFIVDNGSFCEFKVGQIVFINNAVVRIVFE